MKKLIASLMSLAVLVWVAGPLMAVASPIQTTVTPAVGGGGSEDPIVIKVKWEMYTPGYVYGGSEPAQLGEDETKASEGAQLLAPGIWGENLKYDVCAVVHFPNGVAQNVRNVYAEIFWPQDKEMHTSGHGVDTGTDKGTYNLDGVEIDNPSVGCGALIEQNELIKLSQQDGINLVCNTLALNNPSLVKWAGPQYNFEELCNGSDGQLTKSRAAVYCHSKQLTWEDPAGLYRVDVFAYDINNNRSAILTNQFEYLPSIGYQVDFSSVNYGNLAIGQNKRIYGNKFFNESGGSLTPTVRNLGNTRLRIGIAQDDMGLGKLDTNPSLWRVKFDARIGDLEGDWLVYNPFGVKGGPAPTTSQYKPLNELLDLSEIEEMDFSIKVDEKWPVNQASYSGSMWLRATSATWGICGQ